MAGGIFGNCHRYPPPQALVHLNLDQPDRQLKLALAVTQQDAWCGEFRKRGP